MPIAFALAVRQLADPAILRILARCIAITLALFAAIGLAAWYALDAGLAGAGLGDDLIAGADTWRGLAALVAVIVGGWLLWRVLALAVLQFYADEVIAAVEARHYPHSLSTARSLSMREDLRVSVRGARRAILYNLIALPFALVLLVTSVGTVALFLVVNAVLLGRELTETVWLRHVHDPGAPLPLSRASRFMLGGIVAVLFIAPFVNLLAPVIGAAMATHLVHRSGKTSYAPDFA